MSGPGGLPKDRDPYTFKLITKQLWILCDSINKSFGLRVCFIPIFFQIFLPLEVLTSPEHVPKWMEISSMATSDKAVDPRIPSSII